MAIAHAEIHTHSRSEGHTVADGIGYRCGEKVYCPRTGMTVNYRPRGESVEHWEIIAAIKTPIAEDLGTLAAGVEGGEKRADAQIGRDFEFALPHELTPAGRKRLAHAIGRAIIERYETVGALAIHTPPPGRADHPGDPRNYHGHLWFATRALNRDGTLGRKLTELSNKRLARQEVTELRRTYVELTNAALEAEGLDVRIHAGRRIDGDPQPKLGQRCTAIERKARHRRGQRTAGLSVAELVADGGAVTDSGRTLGSHGSRRRQRQRERIARRVSDAQALADDLAATPDRSTPATRVVQLNEPPPAPLQDDAPAQRGPSIAVEQRAIVTFEPALASELSTWQAIRAAPAPTHTGGPTIEALDRATEEEALDESLREMLGLATLPGAPVVAGVAQPRHAPVRAEVSAQRGPSIAVEQRAIVTFEPALASELSTWQAIRAAPAPTHTGGPTIEALDRAAEEEALDESLKEMLGLATPPGVPVVAGAAQPRPAPVRTDALAQRGSLIAVEQRAIATSEPALVSELVTWQAIRPAPAPAHTAAPAIEALDGAAAERRLDENLRPLLGLDVRELAAFQRGVTTHLAAWQARPRSEPTIVALGELKARRHQAHAGATTTPARAPQIETGTERRKANYERLVRAASQPRRHATPGPAARVYRRLRDALGSTEAERRILEKAEIESETLSGSTIVRERRQRRDPHMRTAPTRTQGPLERLAQWIAPKARSDDDLIENALRTILHVLVGSRSADTPPEPPRPVRAGTTAAEERARMRAAVEARVRPTSAKPTAPVPKPAAPTPTPAAPVVPPNDPLARGIDAIAWRVLRVGWERARTPEAQEQRIRRTLKDHGVDDAKTREIAAVQLRPALDRWCRDHYGTEPDGTPVVPTPYDSEFRDDIRDAGGYIGWMDEQHAEWRERRAVELVFEIKRARQRGVRTGVSTAQRPAPGSKPAPSLGSQAGRGPEWW